MMINDNKVQISNKILKPKEEEKVLKYIREYQKLIKRFWRFSRENVKKEQSKEDNKIFREFPPIDDNFLFEEENPVNHLIRRFTAELKTEDYVIRKSYVDKVCDFLEPPYRNYCLEKTYLGKYLYFGDFSCYFLHHIVFYEIFIPVFIVEYKNQNVKYIEWIGRYEGLYPFTSKFLEEIDASDINYKNQNAFKQYFLEKSLMIKKDKENLDCLLALENEEFVFGGEEMMIYSGRLDRLKENLNHYIAKLDKCKRYCKIAGYDKWPKRWEEQFNKRDVIVSKFKNYIEYVEKNGYVSFDDYEKNME